MREEDRNKTYVFERLDLENVTHEPMAHNMRSVSADTTSNKRNTACVSNVQQNM